MTPKHIELLKRSEPRPDEGAACQEIQQILLHNADAVGHMRKELISSFGEEIARRLLLRFGYAHGYQDNINLNEILSARSSAKPVKMSGNNDSPPGDIYSQQLANTRISNGGLPTEMIWHNSFEAIHHLKHFGRSSHPVCWSQVGYASGSRTATEGQDFYYKEVMCMGMGAPYCQVEGRNAAAWGDELETFKSDFVSSAGLTGTIGDLRAEIIRLTNETRCQKEELLRYRKALASRNGSREDFRSGVVNLDDSGRFIVHSSAMAGAIEQAAQIASVHMPVLVQGESGTGKEFFVSLIHKQSERSREPLVSVNCASLSPTLLESELFGHVRGAFTGAVRDKIGLFELARAGTLFLDEIGEMDISLQATLLRVLENGEIRRVGGERCIEVRPRIIAATNRDLRSDFAAGKFRSDLYFRLAAFVITLPPLRERTEDIPVMAHQFMREAASNIGRSVNSIRPDAMMLLTHYPWPGNVRELKHAIERAVIVTKSSGIEIVDLPPEIASAGAEDMDDPLNLKGNELHLIKEALRKFHGNRAAAARALAISPVTLWRKMRRYDLIADHPPADGVVF